MSVFFLGDSNFLMSGSGCDLFAKNSNEEVRNLSVGASPSSVGIFLLSDISFCKDDVVFISYSMNEAAYILQGVFNSKVVFQHLSSMVSKILGAGAHPVIVMFPSKIGLTMDLEADAAFRKFCKTTGVPLIDLAHVMKTALQYGCSVDELMMDDAHVNLKISSVIASLFSDAISIVRSSKQNIRKESLLNLKYRRILAKEISNEDGTMFRKSSLRGADMAVLKLGREILVDVDENEQVCGLMINMGAPGGIVEIEGSNRKSSTSLVTHWDNENPTSFMSIFVHLRDSVQGGGKGVRMRILPKNSEFTEPLMHGRSVYPDLYGEVHIEGVLVATPSSETFTVLDSAEPNNLIAGREAQLAQDVVRLSRSS